MMAVRLPLESCVKRVVWPRGSVRLVTWLNAGSYVMVVVTAPAVPARRVVAITFPMAS